MINLELPKRLVEQQAQVHMLAEHMMRPYSRKYDSLEHEAPAEMAEVSKLIYGQRQGSDSVGKKKIDKNDTTVKNGSNMASVISIAEMCWGDVGLMMALPGSGLGNAAIGAVGSPAQKEKYGSQYAAMAITEPNVGSDSAAVGTTAKLDPATDEWILNGEKIFVSDGDRCDIVVVWANIDKAVGKAGIKSFIVEKGTPGFTLTRLEHKLGLRASDTAAFTLEDCRIPRTNLLGSEEVVTEKGSKKGFGGVMQTFDNTRPAVASMAVGVARAALEMATEVLGKEGYTFNYDKPRNQVSAIEKEFYKMEADLEGARLLTLKAAWMADNGQANSKEASMAKAKAGRVGNYITLRCVELCSSIGYSHELLLEKFARDSKILDIFEGTQQIQQLIVARRVLGKSSADLK